MIRKAFLLFGIFAVFLTACSKQENKIDDTTKASSAAQSSTIKFVVHNTADKIKWFKAIVKEYENKYPDRKVKIEAISGTSQNYCTKLQMMMKNDPSIDVVYEDSFMLQSDIGAGLLAKLNELKDWVGWNEFYKSLRESVTINGSIYAIPVSTDVRGLYYNKEIFKKAGIKTPWQPKNWKDIINTANIIKSRLSGITPISMPLSSAMGEATSMNTLQMLMNGTGNKLFKDGKWQLTGKGIIDSFNFIGKLKQENLLPRLGILMNPQYNNIIQFDLAPKNKIGIILDGSWVAGGWFVKDKKTLNEYSFAKMPTEFGQKPGFVTMSGGWLLGIAEQSKNKKAALEFMKFALNRDNVLKYVLDVNNLAVRKDVAEDPEYPDYLKVPTSFLEYAVFRPANTEYPVVSSNISTAVEKVVTGTATPKQAIQELNETTKRMINKK